MDRKRGHVSIDDLLGSLLESPHARRRAFKAICVNHGLSNKNPIEDERENLKCTHVKTLEFHDVNDHPLLWSYVAITARKPTFRDRSSNRWLCLGYCWRCDGRIWR